MTTSISDTISATTAAAGIAPGQALGLSASAIQPSQFTLSWSAPTTGSVPFSYQPQVRVTGTSAWTSNPASPVATLTTTITSLAANTQYDVRVVTSNGFGTPSNSTTLNVTTGQVIPAAPTQITANSTSSSSVTVGWTPGAGTPPQTFTVSYRTPAGSGSYTAFGTTATTPATSLLVTGLSQGSQYEFTVSAANGAGSTPAATTATATTGSVSVVPSSPTNLNSPSKTAVSVGLAWTVPSTGTHPFNYPVQYAPSGSGNWITAGTTAEPTVSFTVTGLLSGTAYDFRVNATNSAGPGNYSTILTVTTVAAGRHPWMQPANADSMWNRPFGSLAVWSASTDADTLAARAKINTVSATAPIYVATAADPLVTFTSAGTATTQRDNALSATIRCPKSATPGTLGGQMTLFDPTTDATKIWCFTSCVLTNGVDVTGGVTAALGEVDLVCGTMHDAITGNFGYDQGIGVIRAWELDSTQNATGLIQHGLSFGCAATQLLPPTAWNQTALAAGGTAIYWPETHTDVNGPTLYTGKLPAGATLGIPSNVQMPTGLSAGGQMLWKNAQQFGWHWRFSNAGGITLLTEPSLATNSLIVGMRGDLATIVAALCVLRNQGPTAVQGGGVPIAALPQAVDTAVCGAFASPGAPTGVTLATVGQTSVKLTWTQGTGGLPLESFIQWSPATLNTWTVVDVGADITSGTISNLQPATAYDFQVFTKNSGGTGAVSSTVTTTTAGTVSGTWDSTAGSASVTYSGDKLTATAGTFAGGQNSQAAVGTISKSTGKWFFEVKAGVITADWAVGLCNSSFNRGFNIGSDANAVAFYPVSPFLSFWYNDAYLGGGATATADVNGATVSVAFDADAKLFWATTPAMRAANGGGVVWNNSTSANPATGVGGMSFSGMTGALFPAWATNEQTGNAIINYGATAFLITAPSGFNALGGDSITIPPVQVTLKAAMITWLQGLSGNHAIYCQQLLGQSNDDGSNGMASVFSTTGKHPGGLGGNYYNNWDGGWVADPNNDTWMAINWSTPNAALISHWNAGGIVMLSGFMWPSPNIAYPGGPANPSTAGFGTLNASDLVTPGGATYNNWLRTLDDVAAGMKNLIANGVSVILFRPLHEMQGNWFWWGTSFLSNAQFIQLWQITYNYLATTKGLADNLIWIYGACTGGSGSAVARYPGDSYVDIVGWDDYTNTPSTIAAADSAVLTGISASKPRAWTEWGPSVDGVNETVIVNAIRTGSPAPVYWEQWSTHWAVSNQTNISAALNDSYVLCRENLNRPTGTVSSVPGQVTTLAVTSLATTTAALSWVAPTSGGVPTGYTIQAATAAVSTPATVTASPNGACVSGLTTSLIDASGNIWTLASGGFVGFNGTTLSSITSGVVGIAIVSGVVWQINGSANWYSFGLTGGNPNVVSGPASTPGYTSPTNTTVSTVGAGLIDTTGNLWSISSTRQSVKNGVIDQSTSGTALLALVGSAIWEQYSGNGTWYNYSSSGIWPGGGTTSPLTGTAVPAPLPSTALNNSSALTRAWYNHPGTNFCFWNIPLGAGCTWGTGSDADTQDLRHGGIINSPDNFGSPFYVGKSTDLVARFSVGNQGNNSVMYDGSIINSEVWTIHVPQGATSAGPQPLNQNSVDMAFNACDISVPGWYMFAGPLGMNNYQGGVTFHIRDGGDANGNYLPYSIAGSSFYREPVTVDLFHTQQEIAPGVGPPYNQFAGMIRKYDLDPTQNPAVIPGTSIPAIQHVLRYAHDRAYLKSNSTFTGDSSATPLNADSWPVNYQDWQGGTPSSNSNWYLGNLKAGTHIGIPKTTPMPTNLTDAGKQIWTALQTYGGSFHDQAGGGLHFFADQDAYNYGTFANDAQNDLRNIILQYICPLRNQHQGGHDFTSQPVNGPGQRVDPGPLPQAIIPGFPTPSPNYTLITPTTGSITDSFGTIWTVTAGAQVAYQITRNISTWGVITGAPVVVDQGTSNVAQMAYVWGVIWHKNVAGNWYCKTSTFSQFGWVISSPATTSPITAAQANAFPGSAGPKEITTAAPPPPTTAQGPWVTVGTSSQTSGSAVGLTAGTAYVFQVIATNAAGSGTPSATATGTTLAASTSGAQLLPTGELFTGIGASSGQITDANNVPVRIAGVVWSGGHSRTPTLDGLNVVNWQVTMQDMVRYGFNCIRLFTCDWAVANDAAMTGVNYTLNPDLQGLTYLGVLDKIVAYAASIGLRIIIDSHCNDGSNVTQQANGLWYDSGGASNNTDGGGTTGTITDALFLSAWQTRATRWKGKPAILGYDIRHEPLAVGHATPGCTWGGYISKSAHTGTVGSNIDLRSMYQRVGNAIQAIDSHPLIICQAAIDFPSGAYEGDLRGVSSWPVTLTTANKVVYCVHEYPTEVSGYGGRSDPGGLGSADTGATYVSRMQALWGFLVSGNTAPVMVGAMGDYCTSTDAQNWGSTIVSYLNGTAASGIPVTGTQQGVSWLWARWAVTAGTTPDFGVQSAWGTSGVPRQAQSQYWSTMLYAGPASGIKPLVTSPLTGAVSTGTWQLSNINGMYYWLLLPAGYDPKGSVSYPLVLYLHQLDQGTPFYNGGLDPNQDFVKPQIDPWFNNSDLNYRRKYPSIVVAPLLDQRNDTSGNSINWGGINSDPQTGQDNAIALVKYIIQNYNVYTHKVFVTGNSMGGDGTDDIIIKYNTVNGTVGKLFAAALSLAGVTFSHGYPTPDATVVSALKTVPVFAIHGGNNDGNSPIAWDQNMWTAQGGSTSYPGPNGSKAPNATYWYLQDPNLGHDVWDTYYFDDFVWAWLFSKSG